MRADCATTSPVPAYSAASIANAASNQVNAYAPNTFLSIYGRNLAWTTRGLDANDIAGGSLPTVLPGTGVRVWVGRLPAFIYYVSPSQINILLPSSMIPGTTELRVQVDSTYGPRIPLTIAPAAPALFQLDAGTVIAAHVDGQVATADTPATPGEIIILYATGLGPTLPTPADGEIPTGAAPLEDMEGFGILLDGDKIDPTLIGYAGVAPGFAGLYQINVKMPDTVGPNPEIRISAGGVTSPPGLRIPLRSP